MGSEKELGNRFWIPWNWNLRKTGNSLSLVFASTNHENVQWSEQFFHSIFWLEVSRDFKQFLRRLSGIYERNWRVGWVLESGLNSEKFHRCCLEGSKAGGDSKRAKSPKNSSHFENQQKSPGHVSFSSSWKLALRAELGWPRLFNPPTGKKIPTHEMIHRFSTSVQSKSNRTPQNLPKTHSKIKCFSQKALDSILEKFRSKLAWFSEISAEKKTGFSWMTQRLIKYSELFADSTCQLECRSSTGLVNILIVFELSWNCSYRDFLMSRFRWFFPIES